MPQKQYADCKRAPLHLIDRVQSSGALIAIKRDTGLICACSDNISRFTGHPPTSLLNKPWEEFLQPAHVSSLFTSESDASGEIAHVHTGQCGTNTCDIANHSHNGITYVEIESHIEQERNFDSADIAYFLKTIAATSDVEASAKILLNTISIITDFDRVMLYKFLPGWHGEVIAEILKPGIDGFLGLRFPESDLPANARRLYLLNWKRAIYDAAAPTVSIIAADNCKELDLTYSLTRAVHPAHIQYMNNIGTRASFSVSIIIGNALWGLIACHNVSPRRLSLQQQTLCEQLSRVASIHMTDLTAMHTEKLRSGYREAQAEIKGALRANEKSKSTIATQLPTICEIFNATGVYAHIDGTIYKIGVIPDDTSLTVLASWIEKLDNSDIGVYGTIPPELSGIESIVRLASGMLYIPLSENDFIILMRPEQVETVNWAGKPQSISNTATANGALTPRASFQKWTQLVQGSAAPWNYADIEAATRLRELLHEYMDEVRLEGLALHDQLTGLANRHLFEGKLHEAIKLSVHARHFAAVFMLDLDRFKPVNDTMGHAAGDELLVAVAHRLRSIVRERDVVARLGGDEFAIVQFHLSSIDEAAITAERILSELRRSFEIFKQNVEIGVSIGIAICPAHGVEPQTLVQNADLALYQAKHNGRNTFKLFDESMLSKKKEKESVRLSLIKAVEHNEFTFTYQPIVDADTHALVSFEAFARWQHPQSGLLRAAIFMPLIEQYQLAIAFAEWGVRYIVRQAKAWIESGLTLAPISLNISAAQFLNLDIPNLCSNLTEEYNIDLHWLRFDLDESALQIDFERTAGKINALRCMGILTNIDHFGDGPITLRRMVELKINQLKVPGRLFDYDVSNANNDAFTAIINSISSVLAASVVATKIEKAYQEKRAVLAGVDLLQGYRVGRDITAIDVETILRSTQASGDTQCAGRRGKMRYLASH